MLIGWFVRRRIIGIFADIGRRDLSGVIAGMAPTVHHRFGGEHALGGERHDRDAVTRWFARLYRLYPELTFTVHRVVVSGWPWNIVAAVEWTAWAVPAAGTPYENVGAHVIRIERARVTHIHAYEDTQAVVAACAVMAADGIEEAAADPIR